MRRMIFIHRRNGEWSGRAEKVVKVVRLWTHDAWVAERIDGEEACRQSLRLAEREPMSLQAHPSAGAEFGRSQERQASQQLALKLAG